MAINLANPIRSSSLSRGLKMAVVQRGWYGDRNLARLSDAPARGGVYLSGVGPVGGVGSVQSGGSSYLSVPASWMASATNLTYTCWMWRASTGDSVNVGSNIFTADPSQIGTIWYFDGNIYTDAGAGFGYCALGGASWSHIAVVYDSGGATNSDRLKVYLNGVAQSLAYSGTISSPLGGSITEVRFFEDQPGRYGTGKISEYYAWNRSLSADEVWQVYRGTFIETHPLLNKLRSNRPSVYSPAAPSFKSAWARGSNVILQPGVLT